MTQQSKRPAGPLARLARFAANQDGIAAVEFAVGAVVLFSLSMGIIDSGRAMFALNNIEHASKDGARYAAIHGLQSIAPKDDTLIETFVKDKITGITTTTSMSVNTTWQDPLTNAPGTTVTVAVTYPFTFFFGSIFSTTPFNLTAQSTMTISR